MANIAKPVLGILFIASCLVAPSAMFGCLGVGIPSWNDKANNLVKG